MTLWPWTSISAFLNLDRFQLRSSYRREYVTPYPQQKAGMLDPKDTGPLLETPSSSLPHCCQRRPCLQLDITLSDQVHRGTSLGLGPAGATLEAIGTAMADVNYKTLDAK